MDGLSLSHQSMVNDVTGRADLIGQPSSERRKGRVGRLRAGRHQDYVGRVHDHGVQGVAERLDPEMGRFRCFGRGLFRRVSNLGFDPGRVYSDVEIKATSINLRLLTLDILVSFGIRFISLF